MSDLKDRVLESLRKINLELEDSPSEGNSLLAGAAGMELFKINYLTKVKEEEVNEETLRRVEQLIESSVNEPSPTFCSGAAGINCFYVYLNKFGYLSEEDTGFLIDKEQLMKSSLSMLREGNHDFLHGGLGIAYALLLVDGKGSVFYEQYLNQVFDEMEKLSRQCKLGFVLPYLILESLPFNIDVNRVNLGLAHGIPSALKFFVQSYSRGFLKEKSRNMAMQIIEFILSHQNKDNLSVFPNVVELGKDINGHSRLAWCYGDLGIGIMLYQAGKAFNMQSLVERSVEIMLFNSMRRDDDNTFVVDAGLCHGAAGVALIFLKMYKYTGLREFRNAADFWIEKTLGYATHEDVISGFKSYFNPSKSFVQDESLLTGVSGIGLSLISYASDSFDWDFSLMLNDLTQN